MKKLAFILALAGMLVGCSKNTEVSTNQSITRETETEMQNESSTIAQDAASVESVSETKTEEPWIALIEKDIGAIFFQNEKYKILPAGKNDCLEFNFEIEKGIKVDVALRSKYFEDDTMRFTLPEWFQEYAKVVLSSSTLPHDLQKERGVFEINGHKFARTIKVTEFAPDIVFFRLSYYTTTPLYTLECIFSRGAEEFKEEAPQYFEENGDWKGEMPSSEAGYIEFVKKIIDGTIESETARELYKISEDFMKTIEIITLE
ncbi:MULTISPECIES: hypothetical protein [unclassified Treponema]|uniref:hypothetical protein n=1 Tax=unclassified Treponema TaxID=2638727 RepID=UPI0020A49BBD|nr:MULTISPECIES: hypothetical protein [unclassified Treponema]UTC67021.1 hypothetical protein E4O06_13955 [Treponema sp. OMZ 789]UTC69752.1 hypothetical protein E4O01_14095 [Treponema sp. OMZ 790]UTC72466.1 hypothetical protein E4O02_14185 [Treponema sp. OMZ 791]